LFVLEKGDLIFAVALRFIKRLVSPANNRVFSININGLCYPNADGNVKFRKQRVIENLQPQRFKFFSG
jgi:hypothetical protein